MLITHSLRVGTRFRETDLTRATVREYQSSLRSNGYSLMDKYGTIILKGIEIVDEYFNLLGFNSRHLHQDETGFTELGDEFMAVTGLYTRILLSATTCSAKQSNKCINMDKI